MKKLIAGLLVIVCTAASANGYHQHKPRHDWIVPMISGIVIGAAISREQNLPPVYVPPVYVPPVPVPPVYIPPQPRASMCLVTVYDPYSGTFRNEAVPCIKY